MDIVHPAARALVDVARAQDAEVGDGTTSVVVLAGELLKQAKPYVEENVAPQVIIRAYRMAAELAAGKINSLAVPIPRENASEFRKLLERCARTSMYSKVISGQGDFLSKLVVDAVLSLDPKDPDERLIGMKRVPGGAVEDALLVPGVAFKKTFSYAGFEQQPKCFENPGILCLNVELELKAERDNAEVRLEKVSEYQAIVDAEWQLIQQRLEAIVATGAKVVLSKLPIGDLATQFFADREIFCAGRVPSDDMERVLKATGAPLHSTVSDLTSTDPLGKALKFEEKQVGGERWNFIYTRGMGVQIYFAPLANSSLDSADRNTSAPATTTLVLRGGSDHFIAEIERALHDAIMVVRRALVAEKFVAGGGAVEMELSRFLREEAKSRPGRDQLLLSAFAKALETLPRQLCDNAGCDATDLLTQLRKAHAVSGQIWAGLDLDSGSVIDTLAVGIWEPAIVKANMVAAACEAACTILSVDLSIKASKPYDAANTPSGLEQLEAKSNAAMRRA